MNVERTNEVQCYEGGTIIKLNETEKNILHDSEMKKRKKEPVRIINRGISPTQFWQKFAKQADALAAMHEHSKGNNVLCTFVYEEENGYRKFIVSHPETYWLYYSQLPPEQKCTYEIIPEGSPCSLYLDLEFLPRLNPTRDGPRMTDTIINVFCAYILKYWGLAFNKSNVVNLDSTSDVKFSRHLIFSIRSIAFRDNYHIKNLVLSVCQDVLTFLNSESTFHDILSRFTRTHLEELFVETGHGKKLFVDTCVYSKNRHFRIYKSTKRKRHSYLNVARECRHFPLHDYKDPELGIFLDSLISYFPNKHDLTLLEVNQGDSLTAAVKYKHVTAGTNATHSVTKKSSQYPKLDKYIGEIINPGTIRACVYFPRTKVLIYEVVGNRYCENIGRSHKSNNIMWIVDLNKKMVYQKCHDEDCAGFKSASKKIPEEISFYFDEENDTLLAKVLDTMQT